MKLFPSPEGKEWKLKIANPKVIWDSEVWLLVRIDSGEVSLAKILQLFIRQESWLFKNTHPGG